MRANLSASTATGAIFTAERLRRGDHRKEKKKKKKRKTRHIQDYGERAHWKSNGLVTSNRLGRSMLR